LGITLDGDADRVLIADEAGRLVDGDQLMALIATHWRDAGKLKGGGVVATGMSNLGLERYLGGLGLDLVRTDVGDRYVVEYMRAQGYNVGGEQSGHIILGDYSTTGDGLIAALQVLAVIAENGEPASRACRLFEPLPQTLLNVAVNNSGGGDPLAAAVVKKAIAAGRDKLADSGRLLIRPSGTEPLIRVMAEGEDENLIVSVTSDIAAAIEQAAG